jgi:cellulose synthase/poly-beta-1,6-N-acetylglucosamine synthase-like glycosyltransferase
MNSSPPNTPALSVVIPVYNSAAELKQCLSALAGSAYSNFEAIVVDDGSDEPVHQIAAASGFNCIREELRKGPAHARNVGAAAARGEYIVFVDADVCVHADTLSRIAENFATSPHLSAVIGSYDNAPAHQSFVSQFKNLFHHFVHTRNAGEIGTFWCGCGAIRKDVFRRLGGFDEDLYDQPSIEDIELGARMASAGFRILLDEQIQAKHLKRWTLWSLIKTDVMRRGVPWTRLILRSGRMPEALNVTSSQRASVLLAILAVFVVLIGVWEPMAFGASVLLLAAVAVLNRSLYQFFYAERGLWFLLGAVPLHWLYLGYCGVAFFCGAVAHCFARGRAGSPLIREQQ